MRRGRDRLAPGEVRVEVDAARLARTHLAAEYPGCESQPPNEVKGFAGGASFVVVTPHLDLADSVFPDLYVYVVETWRRTSTMSFVRRLVPARELTLSGRVTRRVDVRRLRALTGDDALRDRYATEACSSALPSHTTGQPAPGSDCPRVRRESADPLPLDPRGDRRQSEMTLDRGDRLRGPLGERAGEHDDRLRRLRQ